MYFSVLDFGAWNYGALGTGYPRLGPYDTSKIRRIPQELQPLTSYD